MTYDIIYLHWVILLVNVSKYAIDGVFGYVEMFEFGAVNLDGESFDRHSSTEMVPPGRYERTAG